MPPLDVLAAAEPELVASFAAFADVAAEAPAEAAEDEMPAAALLEAALDAAEGFVAVLAAEDAELMPVMPAWPPAAAVEVPSATTRLTRAARKARVNFILREWLVYVDWLGVDGWV